MPRFLFTAFVLFCLSVHGITMLLAQTADERRERRDRQARSVQSHTNNLFGGGPPPPGTASIVGRSVIHSVDQGFGNTIALLDAGNSQNMRNALGLSETQAQQLKAANEQLKVQMLMRAPAYAKRFKEMGPDDHEEIQQELIKDMQKITEHVESFVTPEQKEKSRTLVFQAMGGLDSPVINPDALSVLKLSKEQQEQTGAVLKEMEKERVAQMEEGLKLFERAVALGGPNMSPEDRATLRADAKALETRIFATGKKLGDRLRSHLTEEQREMEKRLMAERPPFMFPLPGPMRGNFSPEYAPGINSWTPGQGAPSEDMEAKQ